MNFKLVLAMLALSIPDLAATPGIRPVASSRQTRLLAATTTSGQRYLDARQMRVNLGFPDGKNAKGTLYILFDSLSGLYYRDLGWEQDNYPNLDFLGRAEGFSRIGVDEGRLFIATFVPLPTIASGINLLESAEMATSVDDAEARALKWYGDHLTAVEERSERARAHFVPIVAVNFPQGFFRSVYDTNETLAVRVVDLARSEHGGWVFTLENGAHSAPRPRVRVHVEGGPGHWSTGFSFATDEPESKK